MTYLQGGLAHPWGGEGGPGVGEAGGGGAGAGYSREAGGGYHTDARRKRRFNKGRVLVHNRAIPPATLLSSWNNWRPGVTNTGTVWPTGRLRNRPAAKVCCILLARFRGSALGFRFSGSGFRF